MEFRIISGRYIEHAKTKFSETTDNTNSENYNVLEKLLCIDKQTAHVMSLDILLNTETTANAAGAMLYYIANNVKKQKKLREEVMSVLPDKTTLITHDILIHIPYVRACIKESMRLFSIASGILRTMQIDVFIGGYFIPKGSNVMACHAVMSMDPMYFPRPEEYIPERWLRDNPEFSLYKRTHPYVYMPFGYGVRTCVGQRFAEMELEMLLLKNKVKRNPIMIGTRSFIRQINGTRLPLIIENTTLLKILHRERSVKNYPMGYNESKNKDIPGPKRLPLIGNSFRHMRFIGEYHNVNVLTQMRMLRDKYGKIVRFDYAAGKQSLIYLFCPELCKNMYQLQGKWPIRTSMMPLHNYRMSREHIYNGRVGLVTSHGQSWQDFRSKVSPHMMRPQIIKVHIPRIYEIVKDFVEKMRILRDPKTLELPSDFMNELYKWSLESMCSIALNCRLGCLKPNLAVDSDPHIMLNCAQEAFDLIYRLENKPSVLEIYNMVNRRKLFHALDTINEISGRYIEHAKTKFSETTDNTNSENYSVLEKLLCIDKQTAHVMSLDMLLSTETTANAAGAMLYYIANNVKKQEKLREEVMSVLPDKTTPITHDILIHVPYVRACIKESMRLFSIASGILRTMQTDGFIGGYFIPKGSNVMACHAVMSMDPMYFPRPEEYIPERWLRDNPEFSLYKRTHPYVYMPFGYGVRSCVGQRFAEMELEMLLLKVIRNFRIEWHHGSLEYKSQIINTVTSLLRLKLIDL